MAKEKKEKKAPKLGVGALARQLILEGKSNAEVLLAVQKKFPDSKADGGTIGWYRNNLKAAGKRVKNSRDITAGSKKAAAKTTKAPKGAKVPKAAAGTGAVPETQTTAAEPSAAAELA